MMFITKAYQVVNTVVGQVAPQWENGVIDNTHMYTGSWTWTPNSTWVNDFRGGLAYLANATTVLDEATGLAGERLSYRLRNTNGCYEQEHTAACRTIAFSSFSNFQLGGRQSTAPPSAVRKVTSISWITCRICAANTHSGLVSSMSTFSMTKVRVGTYAHRDRWGHICEPDGFSRIGHQW